ncbi:phospholipase B1, membrane-associated [Gracilinanus agilis]|uniref:phospholipase B1, membrane-associated n=1 Tax=Gracilinanus agilis TaxID=191870 RepID=UPI001CFD344B|nr:phospholipase B1, membrane-associated [Gracilinanus agilis]
MCLVVTLFHCLYNVINLISLILLSILSILTTTIQAALGNNSWEEQTWPEGLKNFPFPCKPEEISFSPPSESVHSLRISDIRFVGAIGNLETTPDAKMVLKRQKWTERNQMQTCMQVMTVLSDFIKKFSPSVLPLLCPTRGKVLPRMRNEDLGLQARELVGHMKKNEKLNFHNDWKLINVFFNAQSQCHPCSSSQQEGNMTSSMQELIRLLDYLQQEVPKAFVNLVDISELGNSFQSNNQENGPRDLNEVCECPQEPSRLTTVVQRWYYQNSWEKLLASGRYDTQDTFTVIYHSFLHEIDPSVFPRKQTSGSSLRKLSTALALSLWNGMIDPTGRKEELFTTGQRIPVKCPTQKNPYLFTYRNNNKLSSAPEIKRRSETREGTEIRCPNMDPSNEVPISVHHLRPADVKVIGALGDSLTAGNGAGSMPGNVLDVLTQYRGLSWSIGGNENISTVTTLANILREFNPSLIGFSTGTGNQNSAAAFLNQAVAGATSENLPSQARRLVDLMKENERINFQDDWKIVTLFIGGNDLCDSCNDPLRFSAQNFTAHIGKTLDILHAEVPRAFVNLVTVLSIASLRELYQEENINCPRLILRSLCPCVLKFQDNSTELTTLIELNKQYQEETHRLVDSGRYDTRDDFTVVLQPFLEQVPMPKTPEGLPDSSFFAPDCFHFHGKAHARVARALWNNMLEPVGEKKKEENLENIINVICPSQNQPYLRTYKNSNYTYPTATPTSSPKPGYGSQLWCEDRAPSASFPTSVHALKPADIQVVAAVGDSLTAGNGIGSKPDDLPDVITQYRGLSYSAGGDASLESVTTLPNILREFNMNLTGFAVGVGSADDANAFLNQAVPGAKAEGLKKQVQTLVQKMKTDPRIDFQRDWKVVTLLIGTRDLCDYCTDSNLYSATNFSAHLQDALDFLHREVPRALVNLVDFMNPIILRQVVLGNQDKCPMTQASSLCNCLLTVREESPELARMKEVIKAYQTHIRELVESGRYDTREDFTIVLQPFLEEVKLAFQQDGIPDVSFFAPDCIHPNQKFHSQLSRALWNNMLQPLGKKMDFLDLTADTALSCPSLEEPFLRTYRNSNYTYPASPAIENWGSDFLCPEQGSSNSAPSSVHQLQPADIKVVAALGDSLTTAVGAGAKNDSNWSTAWRGLSWSIGGDGTLETHTTLPNILKKFNPYLHGFSTGTQEEAAGLNVAVGGAIAQDMPSQARILVDRMKNSSEISLDQDWKLITIFVGSNDLCQYCENPEAHSVKNYVQSLQQALDIFYKELPRVFINVVEIMELVGLRQIQGEKCAVTTQSSCPCFGRSLDNSPELQEMKNINRHFQSGSSLITYSHQYMEREDFAVVVQPFFQNTVVPLDDKGKPDLSFFSVDCFHFSERGHAEMAIALWNNMLEPVGQKQTYNNFTYSRTKVKCPTSDNPYFFTMRNSGLLGKEGRNKTPSVPFWAVLVAAAASFLVGMVLVMLWRTKKCSRREERPISLVATVF